MKHLMAMSAIILACGCSHSIHMVHTSGFSPYRKVSQGKIIKASTEQKVILGFVGNTDYVDRAKKKLQKKCPDGQITGITTQFSTSHGFFSWTNKILMSGLCLS